MITIAVGTGVFGFADRSALSFNSAKFADRYNEMNSSFAKSVFGSANGEADRTLGDNNTESDNKGGSPDETAADNELLSEVPQDNAPNELTQDTNQVSRQTTVSTANADAANSYGLVGEQNAAAGIQNDQVPGNINAGENPAAGANNSNAGSTGTGYGYDSDSGSGDSGTGLVSVSGTGSGSGGGGGGAADPGTNGAAADPGAANNGGAPADNNGGAPADNGGNTPDNGSGSGSGSGSGGSETTPFDPLNPPSDTGGGSVPVSDTSVFTEDGDYIMSAGSSSSGAKYSGYYGSGSIINIPAEYTGTDGDGNPYTVPVTTVSFETFHQGANSPNPTVINIPSSVTSITFPSTYISYSGADYSEFVEINYIDPDNTSTKYYSENGILYRKSTDGTLELYRVPYGVAEFPVAKWASNCTSIADDAFGGMVNMTEVTVPAGVTDIAIAPGNYDGVFYKSSVKKVTFEATEGLSFGDYAFINNTGDNSITVVLKQTVPPGLGSFTYGLPSFVVPDSANDNVYLDYLLAYRPKYLGNSDFKKEAAAAYGDAPTEDQLTECFVKYISTVSKSSGAAYAHYYYDPATGYALNAAKNKLARISAAVTANQILDSAKIDSIMPGALKGASFTELYLVNTGSDASKLITLDGDPFGGTIPLDLKIYTPIGQRDAYVTAWSGVLDSLYGEGTADSLFVSEGDLYTDPDDHLIYTLHTDGTRSLHSYTADAAGTITLSDKVIEIEDGALKGKTDLEVLIVPDTVTKVGSKVLDGCSSLRVLAFNGGAPAFAADALTGADNASLKIEVPASKLAAYSAANAGYPKAPQQNGESYEIKKDSSSNEIVYGSAVDDHQTAIYVLSTAKGTVSFQSNKTDEVLSGACADRANVTAINLGKYTNVIGEGAFTGTPVTTLTLCQDSFTVPDHFDTYAGLTALTNISVYGTIVFGDYSFAENQTLQRVTITQNSSYNGGVTAVGDYAFYNCPKLTSFNYSSANITKKLVSIGKSAFENCTALTTIGFGTQANTNSLERIGDYAFRNCTLLTPGNYTNRLGGNSGGSFTALSEIGTSAFENCTGLTVYRFNEALTTIGKDAFKGCGLNYVFQYNDLDVVTGEVFTDATVNNYYIYRDVKDGEFKDAAFLKNEVRIYPSAAESTGYIGVSAFEGTSITDVTLGANISEIGASAFAGVPLKLLTFNTTDQYSLPELGDYIFGDGSALLQGDGSSDDAGFRIKVPAASAGDTNYKTMYWFEYYHQLDDEYGELDRGDYYDITAKWLRYELSEADKASAAELASQTSLAFTPFMLLCAPAERASVIFAPPQNTYSSEASGTGRSTETDMSAGTGPASSTATNMKKASATDMAEEDRADDDYEETEFVDIPTGSKASREIDTMTVTG
ncbi:MAG: leucine-rich repeat protein [Eubacteriales bacterium]|nr:leucine-rich repeat protein [Eubacteriales bacterium]